MRVLRVLALIAVSILASSPRLVLAQPAPPPNKLVGPNSAPRSVLRGRRAGNRQPIVPGHCRWSATQLDPTFIT
jgi:hypothetical protein